LHFLSLLADFLFLSLFSSPLFREDAPPVPFLLRESLPLKIKDY